MAKKPMMGPRRARRITSAQRRARRKNIAIARMVRNRKGTTSLGGKVQKFQKAMTKAGGYQNVMNALGGK